MLLQFLNQLKGANTNLSPFVQPPNSPLVLNGVDVSYKLGAMLKDTGYKNIGSALEAGKSIGGLFNFRQSSSVQKMLATVDDSSSDDTQLFYSTGGAWTEITDAETAWANKAGITVDMEGFIGYCFFVGYGSTDGFLPVGSLTGTTFSTSTNVTNMPGAKYIRRYRDRLYIGNCDITGTAYPYRVYFSSVPVAGSISWTVASDFIDVDYSEEVTGLISAWDRLVIFTEFTTYFYDQSQRKKVWDIGGYHRTACGHGDSIYFVNNDGAWRSRGGQPENISGPVIDFFRAGTASQMFSEIVDEEWWVYFGDSVKVNGVTYANVAGKFNIPTQTWVWREFADTMKTFAKYTASSKSHMWMGDDSGDVHEKGKYTDATILKDDDGTPISSNFELAPFYIGNLSFKSNIAEITAYAERAMGVKLKARVIDRNTRALTKYMPVGELKSYVNSFDVNVEQGVLLQLAGGESGSLEYWSVYGFEVNADDSSKILK